MRRHLVERIPPPQSGQTPASSQQVKSTIAHEECWWGAHLPYT